jgi:hypothetical protein
MSGLKTALVFFLGINSTLSLPLLKHSKIDPPFDWKTLPVVWHSANTTGIWTEAQTAILARYAMVTIEKYQQLKDVVPASTLSHNYADGQGLYSCQDTTNLTRCGCCEEDIIVAASRAIKKINPKVVTIGYLNSDISYPWYRAAHNFASHPSWWLRDAKGNLMHNLNAGNGSVVDNETWLTYDLSVPECADFWIDSCINMTASGVVDSCFVDGCTRRAGGLLPDKSKALNAAKPEMLKKLQKLTPGPLICGSGGTFVDGVAATQSEISPLTSSCARCSRSRSAPTPAPAPAPSCCYRTLVHHCSYSLLLRAVQNWGRGGNYSANDIPLLLKAVAAGVLFQAHGRSVCDNKGKLFISNCIAKR